MKPGGLYQPSGFLCIRRAPDQRCRLGCDSSTSRPEQGLEELQQQIIPLDTVRNGVRDLNHISWSPSAHVAGIERNAQEIRPQRRHPHAPRTGREPGPLSRTVWPLTAAGVADRARAQEVRGLGTHLCTIISF